MLRRQAIYALVIDYSTYLCTCLGLGVLRADLKAYLNKLFSQIPKCREHTDPMGATIRSDIAMFSQSHPSVPYKSECPSGPTQASFELCPIIEA